MTQPKTVYLHGDTVSLILSDCIEMMRSLPDSCIDAIVTDGPYGLEFMGKAWDDFTNYAGFADPSGSPHARNHSVSFVGSPNPTCRNCGGLRSLKTEGSGGRTKCKCEQPDFPNHRTPAMQKLQAFYFDWAIEALRVLKPGGHLLAFGGSRTYHRIACAIEDAGFEVRDSIHWIYGSGFPKSLDVSKAMDKAGGTSPEQTARWLRSSREARGLSRGQVAARIGCTEASVRDWEEGRARANGAPLEFMVPSEAYRIKLEELFSYPTAGREVVGASSDRREDGTVYAVGHSGILRSGGNTDLAKQWNGWGTALKPAHEPIVVARKPLIGTVAANVEKHGTGALNIDATRVGDELRVNPGAANKPGGASLNMSVYGMPGVGPRTAVGRWPPNVLLTHSPGCDASREEDGDGTCESDCPVLQLDLQNNGASRFFPVFKYQAKPSRKEREEGLESLLAISGAEAVEREEDSAGLKSPRAGAGRTAKSVRNSHPTVKPVALMEWLVQLVTPPGGVVLDPFMGSGTTGIAAVILGFQFIGIEREETYFNIAVKRIENAQKE